ncbi:MAG: phosphoribosyltransferase [Chloroflexi bacterium]|nr:phosphoribosyltransferase [Chloroflexota bacterium]
MPRDAGTDEPRGRLWLADLLWRIGCVQFGDFSLGRTVRNSPIYINPKLIVSQPEALARVGALIDEELRLAMSMRNPHVERFDVIAGVPIGGLHIATALSLQMRTPLIYARPRAAGDESGQRPQIEGSYRPGQTALIVDDLATGGGSLVEAVESLRRAGLRVRDAAVLIDREQGATRRLEALGVRLHPTLTLEVLLTFLHGEERIDPDDYRASMAYLHREGEPRSEFDQ